MASTAWRRQFAVEYDPQAVVYWNETDYAHYSGPSCVQFVSLKGLMKNPVLKEVAVSAAAKVAGSTVQATQGTASGLTVLVQNDTNKSDTITSKNPAAGLSKQAVEATAISALGAVGAAVTESGTVIGVQNKNAIDAASSAAQRAGTSAITHIKSPVQIQKEAVEAAASAALGGGGSATTKSAAIAEVKTSLKPTYKRKIFDDPFAFQPRKRAAVVEPFVPRSLAARIGITESESIDALFEEDLTNVTYNTAAHIEAARIEKHTADEAALVFAVDKQHESNIAAASFVEAKVEAAQARAAARKAAELEKRNAAFAAKEEADRLAAIEASSLYITYPSDYQPQGPNRVARKISTTQFAGFQLSNEQRIREAKNKDARERRAELKMIRDEEEAEEREKERKAIKKRLQDLAQKAREKMGGQYNGTAFLYR